MTSCLLVSGSISSYSIDSGGVLGLLGSTPVRSQAGVAVS